MLCSYQAFFLPYFLFSNTGLFYFENVWDVLLSWRPTSCLAPATHVPACGDVLQHLAEVVVVRVV